MNNMENIRELEDELTRVRLGIVEDEKEFKELDKKIKNVYIGVPLGILGLIFGSIAIAKSLPADSTFLFSNSFWTMFSVWSLISLVYPFFVFFGTSAGQRRIKLSKGIEFNKKKKKKTAREENKTIALFIQS